jgi:hypothetical protein
MPMTIDTLEYVKRLEAAGVDRRQAEAHAAAVRDTLAPQLVTKADLDAAVAKLEAKIGNEAAKLEAKIGNEVAKLEAKIGNEVAKLEAKIGNEVARLDGKIDTVGARLEGRLLLVQWMLGFNLFATLGLFGLMLRTVLK